MAKLSIKEFLSQLANVNLPINAQFLQYYRNANRKDYFNSYVDDCIELIRQVTDEQINYFADNSLIDRSSNWDFRMRFFHFIPMCSLTQIHHEITREEQVFHELKQALHLSPAIKSEVEVGQKIAEMIEQS